MRRRDVLRLAAVGLALIGQTAGPLAAGVARGQSAPALGVTVAVRGHSVEALPLFVAARAGLDRANGIALEMRPVALNPINFGSPSPLSSLAKIDAAVATGTDFARIPGSVSIFDFYQRAPVAMLIRTDRWKGQLAGLVVGGPTESDSLASYLAKRVRKWADRPTVLPTESWFGALALYDAGQMDGLIAAAPVPQYAAERSGTIVWDATRESDSPTLAAGSLYVAPRVPESTRAALRGMMSQTMALMASKTDEEIVELVARDYYLWELDALLEAARVARRSLNPTGVLPDGAWDRTLALVAG